MVQLPDSPFDIIEPLDFVGISDWRKSFGKWAYFHVRGYDDIALSRTRYSFLRFLKERNGVVQVPASWQNYDLPSVIKLSPRNHSYVVKSNSDFERACGRVLALFQYTEEFRSRQCQSLCNRLRICPAVYKLANFQEEHCDAFKKMSILINKKFSIDLEAYFSLITFQELSEDFFKDLGKGAPVTWRTAVLTQCFLEEVLQKNFLVYPIHNRKDGRQKALYVERRLHWKGCHYYEDVDIYPKFSFKNASQVKIFYELQRLQLLKDPNKNLFS